MSVTLEEIDQCMKDSNLLHEKKYSKLKGLIETYGGAVPAQKKEEEKETKTEVEDDGLIEKPDGPPYPDIPDNIDEPDYAAAGEFKSQARAFEAEKKWSQALLAYTKCLQANPQSGLTFARRAACLLELGRPNAAIHDCAAALKINPDSSKAKKIRGHAYRLLGEYEKALKDLSEANRYDFDAKTDKLRRVVQDFVKQIKAKRQAKETQEREERRKKSEEHSTSTSSSSGGTGGMPGGMPGGGMAGMLASMLGNDPDIQDALKNPKVMKAFQNILSNPTGAMSDPLMRDPEVMAAMGKIMPKLQGMMGGMGMPGMGGMPGMSRPTTASSGTSNIEVDNDDDDLD